jgi:hypothetical protein
MEDEHALLDGNLVDKLLQKDQPQRSAMATNTDITKMALFAVTDPALITVDFAAIGQAQAKRRATADKLNTKEPDLRKEYNSLRARLYGLTQDAKNAEVYANTQADEVRGLEARINTQLVLKKKATAEGNLQYERNLEHGIITLETELHDAKIEFNRAKTQSTSAARGLKAFDGYETIAALKKQLAA